MAEVKGALSFDDFPSGAFAAGASAPASKPAASFDDFPAGAFASTTPSASPTPPADGAQPSIWQRAWKNLTKPSPFSRAVIDANEREQQAQGMFLKDVALGAGEVATGAGELVPGLQPYAAKGTKYLQSKVDSPLAEDIGYGGAFLAGGEMLGLRKVAGMLPKVAEEAPLLVKTGWNALKSAVTGGVAGAAAGVVHPTGEEDYGKALKAKTKEAQELGAGGVLTGGVLGAAEPLVGAAFEKAVKAYQSAHGVDAETAANALRKAAQERAETAVSKTEETAVGKGVEADLYAAEAQKHATELAHIERAQHQLSEREAKRASAAIVGRDPLTGEPIRGSRDTAQMLSPEALAAERAKVSAEMRDRVHNSVQAAEHMGMKLKDAQAFAVEQESRILDAESAAHTLADDLAAKPTMDAKTFGARVQKLANDTYEKYEKIREQQSGFGEAIQKYGDEPIVDTSKIRALVRDARTKVNNREAEAVLDEIESRIESKVQIGDVPGTVRALSVARADSLRKTLESAIRTKNLRVANNTDASTAEVAHYLARIRGALVSSARSAAPEYSEALNRFRELSRPLDIFERKGALSGAVKEDSLSGEYSMLRADVIGRLLSKTRGGARALQRLMGEDPTLKHDAELYFQHELFGSEGLGRAITPERMRTFLTKHKDALEQTGLFEKFKDVKTAVDTAHEAVARAKADADAARGIVARTAEEKKSVEGVVESERRLSARARAREDELLKAASKPAEDTAAQRAKAAVSRLSAEAKAKNAAKSEAEGSAKAAQREKEAAASLRDDFQRLTSELKVETGLPAEEVASKTETLARKLYDNKFIDQEDYEDMLKDINAVKGKYKDAKTAAGHLRHVLGYGLGVLTGLGGPHVAKYIRYRVLP